MYLRSSRAPTTGRVPRGAQQPWAPQQAEASLVLEHQPHATTVLSLARDLLAYRAAKFF